LVVYSDESRSRCSAHGWEEEKFRSIVERQTSALTRAVKVHKFTTMFEVTGEVIKTHAMLCGDVADTEESTMSVRRCISMLKDILPRFVNLHGTELKVIAMADARINVLQVAVGQSGVIEESKQPNERKKMEQNFEKREKKRLKDERKKQAFVAAVYRHKESAIMKQATSEYPSELVEHIAVLYFLSTALALRQQRGLSLNKLTAQDFVLAISKVHPKPAIGSDLALPTSLADVEEYFEKHTRVTPPADKYQRYSRLSSLKADREKSVPLPSIPTKRPGSGISSPMAKKNKPDDTNGP
jgi:hypothetical protein